MALPPRLTSQCIDTTLLRLGTFHSLSLKIDPLDVAIGEVE